MSFGTPIYYVDLVLRAGLSLEQAVADAQKLAERRRGAGLDQRALDHAAQRGFANGAFEELDEEGAAVVEEFFSADVVDATSHQATSDTLRGRLEARVGHAAVTQEGQPRLGPARSCRSP
jgi:hypothetical protein